MTISGHGNDNGKINYVADNKMPQQMAFHGVVCCLHKAALPGISKGSFQ